VDGVGGKAAQSIRLQARQVSDTPHFTSLHFGCCLTTRLLRIFPYASLDAYHTLSIPFSIEEYLVKAKMERQLLISTSYPFELHFIKALFLARQYRQCVSKCEQQLSLISRETVCLIKTFCRTSPALTRAGRTGTYRISRLLRCLFVRLHGHSHA